MARILIMLAITISLLSCQPQNRVYVKHKALSPNVEWLKKDAREFKVPINDMSFNYDMSLSFRYATGFQHKTINVMVTETAPDGTLTMNEYDLKIRDAKGDYLGEPGYDIWDSEHLIVPHKQFSKTGVYTYKIEHNMPNDPVNMALEIGLIFDKVE